MLTQIPPNPNPNPNPERIEQAIDALKVKLTVVKIQYLDEPYKPKSVRGITFS